MTTETKLMPKWSAELPELLTSGPGGFISGLIRGMSGHIRQALAPAPELGHDLADGIASDELYDGPDTIPGVRPENDPATPELRAKLTRKLLISAIRRYEETLAAAIFMDSAYPTLALPREPLDEAEKAERRAWRRLVDQFDDDFNNAELALASRIQNLYADLALEGRAIHRAMLGDFFERAVRFEGTTYVLNYDVQDYEPETNIIAILRDGRSFDLEGLDDERA